MKTGVFLDAEVAVVGVGIMGSLALWRLAERGIEAIGFERFVPGHDRGSSHGESRIIRTAYFEDSRYVPLVRRSFELWRELECASNTCLLTMTGMLLIGPPDGDVVRGALLSARVHGLDVEIIDSKDFQTRHPQHRLSAGDMVVYEEPAGILAAESCVVAAVQRATTLGARVTSNTTIDGIAVNDGWVAITAGESIFRVRRVIVSVGPWLDTLLPDLKLPLTVERQPIAWFPVRNPAAFCPERFPIFFREIEDGRQRYGFPTLDGETVKVGVHHEGDETTADSVDREIHAQDMAPVTDFIGRYLEGVDPQPVRSQVCLYSNTPDFHFVIGSPPGQPEIVILGGFSGHGFKFAPVIGEAAVDLVADGKTDPAFDLFSLTRF